MINVLNFKLDHEQRYITMKFKWVIRWVLLNTCTIHDTRREGVIKNRCCSHFLTQVVSYRSDNPRLSYFYLLCTHFFVGTWEDATCDDVRVAMNFLPEHVTYLCFSKQIIGTTRLTWFVDSLAKFLISQKCIFNPFTLINEQE